MKTRPLRFVLGGLVAVAIALALLDRERFAPVLTLAGGALALALLPSFVRRWRPSATLSPAELRERLLQPEPPLVLDVRDADEYEGELGHIEGSLLMPVAEIEARLGELTPHRGRLLVPV